MTSPTHGVTVNVTAVPLTYGFTCTEHGVHRFGLTQRHALNVEAKHLREQHTPLLDHILDNLVVDLTAMAAHAVAGYAPSSRKEGATQAADAWESLVGLHGEEARALAHHILERESQVTAAVIPL